MITFRKAKETDMETIRSIAYQTWPSTYNSIVGEEQVEYMLDKMYNKGVLLSQLKAGCTFLLAERAEKTIGFAAFEAVDAVREIFKLHKLYLLPTEHGKGIGKIMINEVYNLSKNAGGKILQLNVNKHNKARDFYERMGFKIKEAVTIEIGNGFVMDDYVMEISLS